MFFDLYYFFIIILPKFSAHSWQFSFFLKVVRQANFHLSAEKNRFFVTRRQPLTAFSLYGSRAGDVMKLRMNKI